MSDLETLIASAPHHVLIDELERRILAAVPHMGDDPPAKNSRQVADEIGLTQVHCRFMLTALIHKGALLPVIMLHPKRRTVLGKGYAKPPRETSGGR